MSRLSRKNRTPHDLGIKSHGGLNDAFDDAIKEFFRINDSEYDFIAENISDEDSFIFLKTPKTYFEKKEIIKIINKYIDLYNNSKSI